MTNVLRLALSASILIAGLALTAFAQCDGPAKNVALTKGSATVSGKTGGCIRYAFKAASGQRLKIAFTSGDSIGRFDMQDGANDETGASVTTDLIGYNEVLEFDEFVITVKGTPSAAFTLKVIVTDE